MKQTKFTDKDLRVCFIPPEGKTIKCGQGFMELHTDMFAKLPANIKITEIIFVFRTNKNNQTISYHGMEIRYFWFKDKKLTWKQKLTAILICSMIPMVIIVSLLIYLFLGEVR